MTFLARYSFVLRPIVPQTIFSSWKLRTYYELVLSVRLLAELFILDSRAEAWLDNHSLINILSRLPALQLTKSVDRLEY